MFYQLALPEVATERIEALLAQVRCPAHPGTSIDSYGGSCAICDLNERAASEAPATYAPAPLTIEQLTSDYADACDLLTTHERECDWQGCARHIELDEHIGQLGEAIEARDPTILGA